MKPAILIISLLVLSSFQLFANDRLPLNIDADPNWKIEFRGEGVERFTLVRPSGECVFLMFSRRPALGGEGQISGLLKKMAEGVLETSKRGSLKEVKQGYQAEEIGGLECSGEAVVFESGNGRQGTTFVTSNGDSLSNREFRGSAEMWVEAKRVLRRIKKS